MSVRTVVRIRDDELFCTIPLCFNRGVIAVDKKAFSDVVSRLKEIGDVVKELPAEMRTSAFELLKPYARGDVAAPVAAAKVAAKSPGQDAEVAAAASADQETFFQSHHHDKPSQNVYLIAADFYREYGCEPFTVKDVKDVADKVGVTVPNRIDMTLGGAKDSGKSLFRSVGRGLFAPTVHGEAYLKTTYGVKKGTKQRQASGQ